MQTQVIPSYLYTQYADDDALAAFVAAYNGMAQEYITLFNTIGLPLYPWLSGDLLDWVAAGLYGILRPVVPAGAARLTGPINTWAYNTIPFNGRSATIGPNYTLASDDIFKRIITWHFYKDDGRQITTRWLKRRIMRFLYGVNGVDYNPAETYPISVRFTGGAAVQVQVAGPFPGLTETIFDYCVRTGILALPFQYEFTVIL